MKCLRQQNIQLVVFDFDGTIADTSEGIIDAHKYTLGVTGKEVPSDETLHGVIGGNLLKTYMATFGFSEDDAREALKIYRKRYAEVGIHKAKVYPGFEELLGLLKSNGYKIGVATLKAEIFAKQMLQEMGINQYFDEVCGMDINDRLDKAGLIVKCAQLCGVELSSVMLVGDSNNDLIGAETAGVHFIGVTYGFGFKPEIKYDFYVVDSVEDLFEYVAK